MSGRGSPSAVVPQVGTKAEAWYIYPGRHSQIFKVGAWLSLVERLLGVQEVASSTLAAPTIFQLTHLPTHHDT